MMFMLLNQYSKSRHSWFLLFLSALGLELCALYFQYILELAPCTLCIYQRCAIFGIMIASLIGFINPKSRLLRVIAIALWLYSAIKGFEIANFHAKLQFAPSLTDHCTINVIFPNWLPLNEWFSSIFNAYGSCAEKIWSFLTIEMSQWMILIFAGYIIVALVIVLSQLFNKKESTLN